MSPRGKFEPATNYKQDPQRRVRSALHQVIPDPINSDIGSSTDHTTVYLTCILWSVDDSLIYILPKTHYFAPDTRLVFGKLGQGWLYDWPRVKNMAIIIQYSAASS